MATEVLSEAVVEMLYQYFKKRLMEEIVVDAPSLNSFGVLVNKDIEPQGRP